jgi:hypothetical protein
MEAPSTCRKKPFSWRLSRSIAFSVICASVVADGNMPVRWEGPKASYHGNIDKPPVTCTPNPKRDASDLAARIRRMILLIDGGTFHLQEEAFLVAAQQVNRFLRG